MWIVRRWLEIKSQYSLVRPAASAGVSVAFAGMGSRSFWRVHVQTKDTSDAQALGVSVDVLLGLAAPRSPKKIATNLLERRLLEIEKLDAKAKRQITQLLDSFIEGQKLKQRATQRASRASEVQH